MKYPTALLAAAIAVSAQAPEAPEAQIEYFGEICTPKNASGYPDFNAPCNAVFAIQAQCIFGPQFLPEAIAAAAANSSDGIFRRQDNGNVAPPMQSNDTQRVCVCESQLFDQVNGCTDCNTKHGNPVPDLGLGNASQLASLSSSYCAASSTPTAGFSDVYNDYAMSLIMALPTSTSSAASSSFSDPIGNMTQVSLYFTPGVTGTAAYIIAEATDSSGSVTASNTQSGQIVATVGATSSAGTKASTTSSGSGAMKTEAVAAAGLVWLAGMIVLL